MLNNKNIQSAHVPSVSFAAAGIEKNTEIMQREKKQQY
jgi:hypothetical protein